MSFTIATGKEGSNPKAPVFFCTIIAPDGSGDTTYLTTKSYYSAQSITYNGNTYLARIIKNELQAIQAISPQGYDILPGFTLTLADGDKFLWTNHVVPHGWRGSAITLTVILWDVVANAYSTDSYQWTFIGGNPQYDDANGTLSVDVTTSTNFTRLKVPSIPLQYRCPWDFPGTLLQRISGLTNQTSIFYQDGYSADIPGGIGNLVAKTTFTGSGITRTSTTATVASTTGFPAVPFQASAGGVEEFLVTNISGLTITIARAQHGSVATAFGAGSTFYVPFTTCDLTRSSPTDPSVGCMARLGKASPPYLISPAAPDGDLTHDIAGNYTARFGGVTWLAGTEFSGRQYVTGQKVYGFNQPNTALPGTYYNWVYGTQWVTAQVLAPAGDPNSLRSEAVVCVAAFGPASILQLLVNGVSIPQGAPQGSSYPGEDPLFTWRYINQGGRSGALNSDAIYNNAGDPHGSVCCIEVIVPAELATPGSIPTVQALVTCGPILNVYSIASVSGGVVTFTGPNYGCAGNPPFQVLIVGNSNSALNGLWALSTWSGGAFGTITLTGTTASGTGGAVFFYGPPDLYDTGGDLASNPTGNYENVAGPACNLAFALLDLMTWGNIELSQIDPVSWYEAAQICATQLSYVAYNGTSQMHAQFKASFAIPSSARQSLAQVMTALRNAGNMMVAPNSQSGLIQCFIKQTLADQQSTPVSGSNYSTAVSSVTAAGSFANGYYAYLFNETNIEFGTFKITSPRIEAIPNTVAFAFQDEYNGYVQDTLTEIDPQSYTYSGNQEVAVPIPINGAPNFDQATRVANVQLAEALYGNPRNDAGGTWFFEFTVNQRVLSLASRLGYICGLVWQPLGIGVSAPQAIRMLSLTPDTDGEHWKIKAMWHEDEWYTYTYGQNPTPFQMNPLLTPPQRPPYPWRPGVPTWGSGDALFPNQNSFQFGVDVDLFPALINIAGVLPVNIQPSTVPPRVPLQASSANTGGTIPPGSYQIIFSTNGTAGPVSNPITVVVPAGTNTNTITVQGIQWQGGAAPSIQPYIGNSSMSMRACASSSYTGSSPDGSGNPTIYKFAAITPDGLGLPDVNCAEFLVEETRLAHGGSFGDSITTVTGSGLVLHFPEVTWTVNQWQNCVLSLYYRPGAPNQPALNLVVSSSGVNSLTMAATGFQAGDVVVMRYNASSITSDTIGCVNAINWYEPSGMTVNGEIGNLVFVIAGTGARQAPKAVISNTSTVLTINGTWDITPDSTSIFIVLAPTIAYSYTTTPFRNASTAGTVTAVAATPAITTWEQTLLVSVSTADANGNTGPWQYQAMREIYVPPQSTTAAPGYYVITGAGPITPDFNNGAVQEYTLTADTAVNPIANAPSGSGQEFVLILIQNSIGDFSMIWDASYLGVGQPSITPNSQTTFVFKQTGTSGQWIQTSIYANG